MKNILFLPIVMFLLSCGNTSPTKSSLSKQNVSPIYNSTELNIKVYYEQDAEPYTDSIAVANLKLWDLFQLNMNALFEGKNTTIKVPKTLDEMTKITSYNKETWSTDDVLEMAKSYPITDVAKTTSFQIFFVNGYAKLNPAIIGLHLSNTKIMVLFKNVIKSSSNGDPFVPKYVEQATLVHEMGHALGLVNNGLPMQSSHQDTEHGAHCSNPNCVMFHSNEGTGSLILYADKIKQDKNLVMFDQACLDDVRKFK